jgi:hypothetical protein
VAATRARGLRWLMRLTHADTSSLATAHERNEVRVLMHAVAGAAYLIVGDRLAEVDPNLLRVGGIYLYRNNSVGQAQEFHAVRNNLRGERVVRLVAGDLHPQRDFCTRPSSSRGSAGRRSCQPTKPAQSPSTLDPQSQALSAAS